MLGGFPKGEPRHPGAVSGQKPDYWLGCDACVLAERPSDCLANEKILFFHGRQAESEQSVLIAGFPPFELMQQRSPAKPKVLVTNPFLHHRGRGGETFHYPPTTVLERGSQESHQGLVTIIQRSSVKKSSGRRLVALRNWSIAAY